MTSQLLSLNSDEYDVRLFVISPVPLSTFVHFTDKKHENSIENQKANDSQSPAECDKADNKSRYPAIKKNVPGYPLNANGVYIAITAVSFVNMQF